MPVIARPLLLALATQHPPGHHDHKQTEQDHQDFFRQLVGKIDTDRRKHRAERRNQECRAIAHQTMPQTVDGPHQCRAAHRKQCDGRRRGHAPAKAKHQRRHGKNAAARTGQTQHQAHDHTKKTRQPHKTLVIHDKGRERPVSIQ
ncbi:hypothetical protein D3C87_1534340 [compost metagenome]